MSDRKNKSQEAVWIAEEIFEDPALNLRSKCLAVDDQITCGVLNLEDALGIYEVSLDEYLNFYLAEQASQAETRFNGKSAKFQTMIRVKYLNYFFHHLTGIDQSDLVVNIGDNMNKLEDDLNTAIKVI